MLMWYSPVESLALPARDAHQGMSCFSQGFCCYPNRKAFSHLLCRCKPFNSCRLPHLTFEQVRRTAMCVSDVAAGGSNAPHHCMPTARKLQRRSYVGPSMWVAKLLAWELMLADSTMTWWCTEQ
ncbi:hypothetical protein XENOCAPTIV_029931 [Xenoophorus captivus]|uniref:Secreted protein n=1 Tax=Xenoophorus captivus TaxID=1517983 RepID=A0ABV0QF88_9TELE